MFLFCIGTCFSVSRWLLCSRWLLSSQRHSTVLVTRLAPVEGHRPFPMRHPPVRQTRRQLCDILCPPVRQTRRQLCDILCPPVRQTRRQLCDILCPPVRQTRRQLCQATLRYLFPRARRRLCNILDFQRIPTAFASSPKRRAHLRDGAAEFGAGSASPDFLSAIALRRLEPYH